MNQTNSLTILKQFFQLSVISGFFTALSGILAMAVALYTVVLRQSEFSAYYDQLLSKPVDTPGQLIAVTEEINRSSFAADSAVFVFWMIIGLFVYILGEIAYKMIRGGSSFFEEMNHTIPSHRVTLFAVATQHLLLRLIGVVGLYALYMLSLKALPLVAVSVYWLEGYSNILSMIVLVGLALAIGSLIAYCVTLCLRLIMYRLRVFGGSYKYDE